MAFRRVRKWFHRKKVSGYEKAHIGIVRTDLRNVDPECRPSISREIHEAATGWKDRHSPASW